MKNLTNLLTAKPHRLNCIIFLVILCLTLILYWECRDNYFFSDDFEWLARGVLAQNLPDAPAEITRIEGRDFNPVFMIVLTLMIRIFGLSPLAFRLLCIITFTLVIFMLYHIPARYFRVNPFISLSAALLCGFNVYISEILLNMSAWVYTLALLFFLVGLQFLFEGKRLWYFIFLLLAFLTKETIILAAIPLPVLEFEKKKSGTGRFIIISTGALLLTRGLLQWLTAVPGKYTGFLGLSHFFDKFYFISLRGLGISPYSLNPTAGTAILILLVLASGYFAFYKKNRGFLYFFLFFVIFALFFSLLPKLSSRYFFYPSIGIWGMAMLGLHYFAAQNKKFTYVPALLLIAMSFHFPLIKREIGDYKILGDFSRQFIQQQAPLITATPALKEITLYKQDFQPLAGVYRQIKERDNLPKLLPFREHGLGGVIEPAHLIPLVSYPRKIMRWHLVKETPGYFTGQLEITSECNLIGHFL